MQIIQEDLNGALKKITIKGEMGTNQCDQIQPTFDEILSTSTNTHVAIHMRDVVFLDSVGIGLIVFLYKRLKANGGDLTLHEVNGQPRELLELLRIHKALKISWWQQQDQLLAS